MRNIIWLVLAVLGLTQAACVMDAKDWDQTHPIDADAGTGGTCDNGCGGSGGSNTVCSPGETKACPSGQSGVVACNMAGTGWDSYCHANGSGGSGGSGSLCSPGATKDCPAGQTGVVICDMAGSNWVSYCTNGGTGGSGGTGEPCGGHCAAGTVCDVATNTCITQGTGGSGGSNTGSCQGNGVMHTLHIVCAAPASEFAVIDIKGGSVVYYPDDLYKSEARPDEEAKWCEPWYNAPLGTSTVQGANTVLDWSKQIQGKTSRELQTYLRETANASDGNTPHGFSNPEIQLPSDATCQAFVDDIALTDSKGQPYACSADCNACAKWADNPAGHPWHNLRVFIKN